jgi:hypothetical protein
MAPLVDPDCVQFEVFTAKALEYCGYSDAAPNSLGNCGKWKS